MRADEIRRQLLAEGPMAILPWALEALCLIAEDEKTLALFREAAQRSAPVSRKGVAVLPIYGPISQKSSLMQVLFGGTSTEALGDSIDRIAGDKSIGTVVFDVHSPGGSTRGVPELAAKIAAMPQKTIAVANSVMGSAAYWLSSQAGKIVATPSADVGAIGVFAMHQDLSGALERDGVKISFISAGRYKVEGNPTEPLSDEARAFTQARVDEEYGAFIKAVADGRGVTPGKVKSDFGEGRALSARSAQSAGMVDKIATFDQVMQELGAGPGTVVTSLAAGQPAEAVAARRRAVVAALNHK
jgi:signal peptide peptidase SppA